MNRTLLFGEGLFETIRWLGENRKLRLHYRRLSDSASFLEIPCPSYEEFLSSIKTAAGDRRNVAIRFCLLSQGSDYFADRPKGYEVKVILRNIPPPPARVSLTFSHMRRHSSNLLFRHKTTGYLFSILMKREAIRQGFYDAIALNERGELTECSASNLIVAIGGKLYTPAAECGLLRGTTLHAIGSSVDLKEERLRVSDLEKAEAVFITNSLVGVVPVGSIKGRELHVDEDLLLEMRSALKEWEEPEAT